MQRHGWRIIPVNPHADAILGEPVYRALRDVPEPIGLVNVFRPALGPRTAPRSGRSSSDAAYSACKPFLVCS
jgi:predicted CoA-binding protein